MKSKKPFGNRKNLPQLLRRVSQFSPRNKLKDLDMFFTFNFLENSLAVLSWGTLSAEISNCKSENYVVMVVPRVIVRPSPRRNSEAASGDRAPTASGDREYDIPRWLQPFKEGLAEGEAGSSGSAGETIPNTLLPHSPAISKQTQDSTIQLKNPQRYFMEYALKRA